MWNGLLGLLPPALRRLFLACLTWSVGSGLYFFLWPTYARALGASGVDLGVLYGLAFLLTTLAAVPGGLLADRADRRLVLVWSWLVALPAPPLYALAPDWRWLVPGVVLFFGSSFSIPALQAYVIESVPAHRVGFALTLVLAAYPLGMVVSPAVGGLMTEAWGMRATLLAASGWYALSTAIVWRLPPQPPRPAPAGAAGPGSRLHPSTLEPGVVRVTLAASAVTAAMFLAAAFVPPYLEEVGGASAARIGTLGSLSALAAALSGPLLGRIADRRGPGWPAAGALLLLAAHGVLLALGPGRSLLAAGSLALRGAAEGSKGLLAWAVGRAAPAGGLGRALALFHLVSGLASTAAAYAGGWLYSVDPAWPLRVTVLAAGLCLPLTPLLAAGPVRPAARPSPGPLQAGPETGAGAEPPRT